MSPCLSDLQNVADIIRLRGSEHVSTNPEIHKILGLTEIPTVLPVWYVPGTVSTLESRAEYAIKVLEETCSASIRC